MKTEQHDNRKTKVEVTKLRRITMNATKLTFIVFSATAFILGGCSGDNRITAPGDVDTPDIDKDLVELTTPVEAENSTARIAISSQELKIERTEFEATVKKSDVEGGCWYLENEEFTRYTPYFEEYTPRLYIGQKLHVFGYVDENMSSFCMIGPVFHIEKYKNLSREGYAPISDAVVGSAERAAAESASGGTDTNVRVSAETESRSGKTSLKGYYFSNDEGCIYIRDGKEIIAELHFTWLKCPNIQNGTLIAVEGEYSLLTWSPCNLAPLFNVEKFQVLEANHLVLEDVREGK